MTDQQFAGRLAVQQRVLPDYRVPFFELLAQRCARGMSLFAGDPRPDEGIHPTTSLEHARLHRARNIHLFFGSLYLLRQPDLIQWLESWQPDALVLEANPRYLSSPAAVDWMHARGRKVVGWGLGAPRMTGPIADWRTKRRTAFLNRFDTLVAYSERGAREYANAGFNPERVFVAHNAVSEAPRGSAMQRSVRVQRPTVLSVGRLQKRKRIHLLLNACARLTEPPRLVIVGDGPERGSLESLARRVCPSAEFVGERRGADLGDFFAQADLFVLPGTGGLAVQQAMGHALPVIVAQGDGTQDDLVRVGNGWQVPPDDVDALHGALRSALSDIGRLRAMGRESYRIVSEEINIRRMADVFVRVLNSL